MDLRLAVIDVCDALGPLAREKDVRLTMRPARTAP
jgi:hypothetical protein